MKSVEVIGKFVSENKEPLEGEIQFIPDRLWISAHGRTYATLSPRVMLEDGKFKVHVSPTDTEEMPWMYTVKTPFGIFRVQISSKNKRVLLKNLLGAYRV